MIQVAQKRGMSMDALAYKVRMSPWEWVPYSGGSGKDEGVSIIFDIGEFQLLPPN